ncbi:MAG: YheC/YheD family protein [Defluviitaleaceae bacterium]|nr:YheC/YheD family protein [Defluviitaleaceae bacterium]
MSDDKNNMVGYWLPTADSKTDTISRNMEAYFASALMYGVNFFVFSSKDVDIENELVNGTFWEDGKYFKKIVPMPIVFDLRLGSGVHKKSPDVLQALNQSGYRVSRAYIGTKLVNSMRLSKGKFSSFLIDYARYGEDKIESFLEKHGTIILKPESGSNGKGIYKLQHSDQDTVEVHYLTDKTKMKLADFIAENREVLQKKYLMQRFIESTTSDGSPMDIRLNMARGKGGKWGLNLVYIRLGNASYVGTNIGKEMRARSIDVRGALSFQLGAKEGKRIYEEVKKFATDFPEYFQKRVDFIIPELCIDIGIDRGDENKLRIFEIGVSPGGVFPYNMIYPSENIQFYKYLMEERDDLLNPFRENTIKLNT